MSDDQAPPGRVVLVTSGELLYHPRHYHLLAVGLKRAGFDVLVVGQPDPTESDRDGEVSVALLPTRKGRVARMLSGPAAMLRVVRLKPALIQVNSLDLLPWGVIAKLLTPAAVVYDSKEDYAAYMLLKTWLPRPLRRPLSWLVGRVEPWLAGRLDATLLADPLTARRFEPRVNRTLVLHNYPWRATAQVPATAPLIHDVLYHGTLPDYHVDNFIETALALKRRGIDVRWCLAAREYGGAERARLEQRIEGAGLAQDFTLLYNLPFEEMGPLVASSRVGFIPLPDFEKFRRNLPRKLFEFMAAGRPSVVSDLPPVRLLLGDRECAILTPPGDAEAYADAIERLLSDQSLAAEMGRRGRDLILGEMNAEAELRRYAALCTELVLRADGS